ncbi:tetratricopeptide repeat protein [Pseudochrobactrum sp. HB0163]|uniref:tetratricopeptide repeat protein n=1 Tax=Pseudochrobactrum sp. HB0163 TaxID=3450708 RepID=UPI003F6DD6DE
MNPGSEILQLEFTLDVNMEGGKIYWKLINPTSRLIHWADIIHIEKADSTEKTIELLTERLAFNIAGNNGAVYKLKNIFSVYRREAADCISQTGRVALIDDATVALRTVHCLQSLVDEAPKRGDLQGLLSIVLNYYAEIVAASGNNAEPWFELARISASTALSLSPWSFYAREAQIYAAFYSGDNTRFHKISSQLLQDYPGNPALKIKIGSRLIRLGDYEQGRALLLDGMQNSQEADKLNYLSAALSYLGELNFQAAFIYINRVDSSDHYFVPAFKAVALAGVGDISAAKNEWQQVIKMKPDYENHMIEDMRAHRLNEALLNIIFRTLKKNGILSDQAQM